jgi:hypothetical protein
MPAPRSTFALRLRISERVGALPKLHGDILDVSSGKPCFGALGARTTCESCTSIDAGGIAEVVYILGNSFHAVTVLIETDVRLERV